MRFSDTPILVTGFNRPLLLRTVLSSLELSGQENVWFSLDGPRKDRIIDRELVTDCQNLIKASPLYSPDKVLFRTQNIGCKFGMSEAISWFFSHNSSGIIVEDDLILSTDFFIFASECLQRYKDVESVGSITGFMPISIKDDFSTGDISLVSHPFFSAWGWASWANRWRHYDVTLKRPESRMNFIKLISRTFRYNPRYWVRRYKDFDRGLVDSWDFQFLFLHLAHRWKVIAPPTNLVGNQGFGSDATHTKRHKNIPDIQNLPSDLNYEEISDFDNDMIRKYLEKQFGIRKALIL